LGGAEAGRAMGLFGLRPEQKKLVGVKDYALVVRKTGTRTKWELIDMMAPVHAKRVLA